MNKRERARQWALKQRELRAEKAAANKRKLSLTYSREDNAVKRRDGEKGEGGSESVAKKCNKAAVDEALGLSRPAPLPERPDSGSLTICNREDMTRAAAASLPVFAEHTCRKDGAASVTKASANADTHAAITTATAVAAAEAATATPAVNSNSEPGAPLPPWQPSAYVAHLEAAVRTVLDLNARTPLLLDEEQLMLRTFLGMSLPARSLQARLICYKDKWNRVGQRMLKYHEVGPGAPEWFIERQRSQGVSQEEQKWHPATMQQLFDAIQDALNELVKHGFIQALPQEQGRTELSQLLGELKGVLKADEVKQVAQDMKIGSGGKKNGNWTSKGDMMDKLQEVVRTQPTLTGRPPPVLKDIKRLLRANLMGLEEPVKLSPDQHLLVKICPTMCHMLRRVIRLHQLTASSSALSRGEGAGSVWDPPLWDTSRQCFFGKQKHADYVCNPLVPAFSNRNQLLRWEASVEIMVNFKKVHPGERLTGDIETSVNRVNKALLVFDKNAQLEASSDEPSASDVSTAISIGRCCFFCLQKHLGWDDTSIAGAIASQGDKPSCFKAEAELNCAAHGDDSSGNDNTGAEDSPGSFEEEEDGDECNSESEAEEESYSQHAMEIVRTLKLFAAQQAQQEGETGESTRPGFLLQLDGGWVLASVIWSTVDLLERARRYREAIQMLCCLLRTSYTPHRRGRWWNRLGIDLKHLKQKAASQAVYALGLCDKKVRGGDRLDLIKRIRRRDKGHEKHDVEEGRIEHAGNIVDLHGHEELRKSSHLVGLEEALRQWCAPKHVDQAAGKLQAPNTCRAPAEANIVTKTIIGNALNSVPGQKSHFVDAAEGNPCSVEELGLEHYAQRDEGGWHGWHCEGSHVRTIFALLCWDMLFMPVPNVFQTLYQDAPLDLDYYPFFYCSRRRELDALLDRMKSSCAAELCDWVGASWQRHKGQLCRGIRWEDGDGIVRQHQLVAAALGGPALASICAALALDYKHFGAGLPDLLLIRAKKFEGGNLVTAEELELQLLGTGGGQGSDPVLETAEPAAAEICSDEPDAAHMGLVGSELAAMYNVEVAFVEVKSQRDKLSQRQVAWLAMLGAYGVKSWVLKVLYLFPLSILLIQLTSHACNMPPAHRFSRATARKPKERGARGYLVGETANDLQRLYM
ncbi:unnamed protein product [Chrysoparadoxa australica]